MKKLLYINFMLFPYIFLYLTRAGLSWTPGRGSYPPEAPSVSVGLLGDGWPAGARAPRPNLYIQTNGLDFHAVFYI